ncbi:MAG: (5-formylfuran-3-yl)methyl phosphate synthase [Pseudomonadota bacterium]
MTAVLASVTSIEEAELVLAAGADLIDLKDPSAGALGALPGETIRAVVARIAGRRPVSATVGDLPMVPRTVATAVARAARLGVDIVKVGLFPGGNREACLEVLADEARRGRRIVLVMFADQRLDFSLIERARDLGLAGVMLDTADKRGGGLRRHLDEATLAAFTARARGAGLLCGLAGSLALADIPALLPLRPDYLGFRGALCRDGRTTALDPARVRAVCAAVRGASAGQPAAVRAAIAAAGAQRAAHSRTSAGPETSAAKSV